MSSEEKIISYLKGCPADATYSVLEIARAVGLDRKDVNRDLYNLKSTDQLHASEDCPPKWSFVTSEKVDRPTPEVSKKQLSKEEQDSIMTILKTDTDGKGMTAGEISNNLNQECKSVKKILYDLNEMGKVEKLTERLWVLTVSGNEDPGDSDTNISQNQTSSAERKLNFFKKHKAELETRLSIAPVLIQLEACGILHNVEREIVETKGTDVSRNHALIVMLSKKGELAQGKFYEILKKTDPYLVKDLEK